MIDDRTLITISVPVLNEEDNIERLLDRLDAFAAVESGYRFEFLFTDNRSTDNTFSILKARAETDPRIRVLRFSRNFGFQKSILTNFLNSRGAAAVQIDADLQDPPELISEFLRHWEKGYKVVYGVRRRRKESAVMSWLRNAYYYLVDVLSHTPIPRGAGDFRLIDRKIMEHLRVVDEQTPYLRGLIADLGYAQVGVPYDREARVAGQSKFRPFQLIELGIDGLTAQSIRPLRFITVIGVLVCLASFLSILYYLFVFIWSGGMLPSGFTTLVIMTLFSIGLNALFMGVLGEYVGRIFNNTRGLPLAIIEEQAGQENEETKP